MKYNDLIILVPCHSLEDFPSELNEDAAASLLNAFAIVWHPHLLASTGAFPTWERAEDIVEVRADRLVIIPKPCDDLIPQTWVERARREGTIVIQGEHQREAMLKLALEPLGELPAVDPELVRDFLALGTMYLQVELLTRHMRNFSHIDAVHLQREVTAAAKAAINQDAEATRTHLTHCFEMLLECRERFYPVDAYLIDLCLLNPELAKDSLRQLLDTKVPVNLLAPVTDWEQIVAADERWQPLIQAAWKQGSAEVIGGEYADLPTPLMPLDTTIQQFDKGRRKLRELFGKVPAIWGRKRFALGTHLPQILHRFNYRGALHFVMDDGLYPDEEQSNLQWEGADGTSINAFSRLPMAADSASSFLRFAMRMAESMDYDHTAAVIFVRWPEMRTPWLDDFRRASTYLPTVGKFVTLSEYFSNTETQGRMSDFKAGEYFTANFVYAVARREANPISRYLQMWERQRRFETVSWCQAMSQLLKSVKSLSEDAELVAAMDAADPEHPTPAVDVLLQERLDSASQVLANQLTGQANAATDSQDGLLILNPTSFARKVFVNWPQGTAPAKESSVVHRQLDENTTGAVVDLPPSGFVWVSAKPMTEKTAPGKLPLAEDLILRNEFFEARLSEVTGGIGGVQTYQRSPNRISQQATFRFATERTIKSGEDTFKTHYAAMLLREARVLSAGPTVGEIETVGDIVDEQKRECLATYRQVTRIIRGRPQLDVDLEFNVEKMPSGDPWSNYFGCRFAWKHSTAAMTASMQQGAHPIRGHRIEAPQFIEIADDRFRTTLLTPGLTFHRRSGERMLDTIMIVEGEEQRRFQFSIAVDAKYPMQATLDTFTPPLVVRAANPPAGGQQGWLFFVGAQNVVLERLLPLADTGRSGFRVRLLETEGRRKTFPLQCFRPPVQARQVDFDGQPVTTLKVVDEQVLIDIAPFEICDVELLYE